ncbi:MAG: hypothetical protein HZB36_08300 [Candidatus Omnitrophica bacterium]|nr:hypothetical protein [Candidatus Omnitrophota bacterium]
MQKIRYEIDPHNRLAVRGPGRFREVVDGEFGLQGANTLVYHVKRSDNIDVPQQIKFSGDWSLDKDHNLVLTLDKWNNQCEGNKLVLKCDLLGAHDDELAFSIESRDTTGNRRLYVLCFAGAWQADEYNRLSFKLAEEKGALGKLTLQGKWEINKHNEITYTYTRASLKTREKIKSVITLRGSWDITGKFRLSYVLNKNIGSQLDLKVSFERAENDSLVYGISAGYGEKKREIALFGRWKAAKGLGLFFEIKYSGGVAKVEGKLLKSFLKGRGEAFVKTLVSQKEAAIIGGMGFKW